MKGNSNGMAEIISALEDKIKLQVNGLNHYSVYVDGHVSDYIANKIVKLYKSQGWGRVECKNGGINSPNGNSVLLDLWRNKK